MMKLSMLLLILMFSASVSARDDKLMFSIEGLIERAIAENIIDGSVKFYFGDTSHAKPQKTFGEFSTNKKTNAFNKSDREACEWVFLSAIKALHLRAKKLQANAVINIQSNYKNKPVKSNTEFQCGAGALIAGVALKGDVVKL